MSGDARCRRFALDISEPLFRLATECVRLYSNESRQLQSFSDLVNHRAGFASALDHNPETIRMHLRWVPTKGDIRIDLSVTETAAANLVEAKKLLKCPIGMDLTLADALSIMLFDYVVIHKSNKVKAKLGLNERNRDSRISSRGTRPGDNVIRLK